MLLMNGIPIERRPPRGSDPLEPIIQKLKAGESLIFFPEGSRGKAGVVAPFRRGIGLLAREFPGLLVVPVFLSGPERIWPRGEAPRPWPSRKWPGCQWWAWLPSSSRNGCGRDPRWQPSLP